MMFDDSGIKLLNIINIIIYYNTVYHLFSAPPSFIKCTFGIHWDPR